MHHALSRAAVVLCTLSAVLYSFTTYRFGLSPPMMAGFKSTNSSVNLAWYAPSNTSVTNLNHVINGTGVYGFIFNSSTDPPGTPYGTYNWCNMPHVRPQEYKKADSEYQLEYVELVCFPVAVLLRLQTLNDADSPAS